MSEYEKTTNPNTFRPCCPYLGLANDRTIMLMTATPVHRCYTQTKPFAPDLNRQNNYCLVDTHVNCPFYNPQALAPITATQPTLPVQTAEPTRPRLISTILFPSQSSAPVIQSPTALIGSVPHLLSAPKLSSWFLMAALFVLGLLLLGLLIVFFPKYLNVGGSVQSATPAVQQVSVVVNRTESITATATVAVSPTATLKPIQVAIILQPTATPTTTVDSGRFVTPTPEPNGQVFNLTPHDAEVGWWNSGDKRRSYLGDSYLYAGSTDGNTRLSAMRFDLSRVPRGAPIRTAQLRLTGLRQTSAVSQKGALWLMQLIPEKSLKSLSGVDFLTMYSAPASITLLPQLSATDVAVEQVNEWELDANAKAWLERQLLDGAKSVIVRILPSADGGDFLFAWDSGSGPETKGNPPSLLISVGPPPPTPPPLPTRPVIVATLTPVPANVLTVVAIAQTATNVAVTTGTYTPIPIDIVTPTPYPKNLETVQAVALEKQLPAVVLETPTPANPAMAKADADYATAVALTTGTFTPVPTGYVTPVLIYPSPPAENVATAAARVVQATAQAASGVVTPTLPYNAVLAEYVYATLVPENQATAAAQYEVATAFAKVNGTPTPLAWNVVVITPVPSPVPPTFTPLPALQSVKDFTPTPTSTAPAVIPDHIPDYYRNKILFKTNRGGTEEIYALDPNSGELYRVNEPWVYPLAQKQLGLSPDGKQEAIVKKASQVDKNEVGQKNYSETFQIFTHSFEYDKTKQITTYQGISYDPTWSPKGDLIAFVSTNSGNDEIYTVTPDGSVVKQLTVNKFEWDKHPTWSPDGNQIVFMSNRETGRRQLWMMNADGSNQHNLSNDPYEDWEPIWVR